MSDREEWTEWRLHDGSGCPCKGMWVQTKDASGDLFEHVAHGRVDTVPGGIDRECDLWDWSTLLPGDWPSRIILYRIRTPRALIHLREMIETLPAPSRQKEDA